MRPDQQTANQLSGIVTWKVLGLSHSAIAKKMRIPKRQVDFLLWKHLRRKQLPRSTIRNAELQTHIWLVNHDIRGIGVRAVEETA